MMHEAMRGESDAQTSYEDFVKDSNAAIFEAEKMIVAKGEEKAKAELELVDAEKLLESVVLELEQLADYKEQLHAACDFVLKNFEIRQTGRDQEIEALKQAKQILSGAKFDALMQEMSDQDAQSPASDASEMDLLPEIGEVRRAHAGDVRPGRPEPRVGRERDGPAPGDWREGLGCGPDRAPVSWPSRERSRE